jgi:alanyl-tRNA synthetase
MERLYWTDPNVWEAEVEVREIEPGKVSIDPILFHPDEGGQPADKGTIGDATVVDVQVVAGRIVHTLDKPLPGGRYVARLDKERRLHTATHHTAQHILSAVASKQFGLETVGVHIGLEGGTVDFHEKLGWDVAADIERRALDVVMQDIPVKTSLGDQAPQARQRFGPIEADVVRVVSIGDYDVSACCGAHVATTGRIGLIRIFDIESKKAGTRVSFLAGQKALERSQSETAVLRELRDAARCATADLPATLQKAMERSKELAKEVSHLWSLRLSDVAKSAPTMAFESTTIGVYSGDVPREFVCPLAGMIAEATGGAGIVVSDAQIAVSSKTLSAVGLLKRIQGFAGGKGGGSAQAANGRLDRSLTAQQIMESLRSGPQAGT